MSGMTTRSRRSQGPPQPNYDIPPPPSGAVLSPTPELQRGRPGAANGNTCIGLLLAACECTCMRACHSLSGDWHMTAMEQLETLRTIVSMCR